MMIRLFKKKMLSEDSRVHRRLRSFCLIKYNLVNNPAHKKTVTNARDISAGGVLFTSDANFPKGSMLEMDIYLPPLKNFFTAMANIVDTTKIKGTKQYWARARFTAIDPEDKKRIQAYVEHISKDPSMHKHLDKKAPRFKRTSA